MNWFKRKIIQWVREDWEKENKKYQDVGIVARSETNSPETDPVLTFRLYSANNGQILEFRSYDRVKDRSFSSTYIVNKDSDIGEYVSKCLSLEMLK
jgi:hypothetical protein